MNINQSLKMLDKDPVAVFRCTSCSYLVPSYSSEFGICPFCELSSDKNDSQLKQNRQLLDILNQIQQSMSSGKFDDALKLYDALFDLTKSPGAIYSKGVFHAFLADIEFAKRDYQTPNGFMEENSIHAKSALSHFSSAKALFFKAISLISASPNVDSTLLYTKFLCNIKLARMGDGKKSLEALNANFKELPITIYANMVYNSLENKKQAEPFFEKAISLGIPTTFYYYSNYLSNKNDLNNAKSILVKLSKRVDMEQSKKLLAGIQRAQTIL